MGLTGAVVSRREVGWALLGLGVLTAALYGAYVARADFYLDDWAIVARERFDPGLSASGAGLGSRLGYWIYVRAAYELFGSDATGYLVLSAALACLCAVALFILLRMVGAGSVPAATISALTIAAPLGDSARLWIAAAPAQLALLFLLAGLIVALRGLRYRGRRAVAVHALAVLLYVAAVLTYELVAAAALAAGLLYVTFTSWRNARWRWGFDAAVVLGAAALVAATTGKSGDGVGVALHKTLWFAEDAVLIAGRLGLYPDGAGVRGVLLRPFTIAVLIGFAVIAVAATRKALTLPAGDPRRSSLRRWLAMFVAGALAVALGYAALVPSSGYDPLAPGFDNRINVLAAPAFVLAIYALMTLGAILVLGARRTHLVTGAVTIACLGLFAAYSTRLLHHEADFRTAERAERQAAQLVAARVPRPRERALVLGFGLRDQVAPGVPLFIASWDLRGALQLLWDDPALAAAPERAFARIMCTPAGVGTKPGFRLGIYGATTFVDMRTGAHAGIRSERDCRRLLPRYWSGGA